MVLNFNEDTSYNTLVDDDSDINDDDGDDGDDDDDGDGDNGDDDDDECVQMLSYGLSR